MNQNSQPNSFLLAAGFTVGLLSFSNGISYTITSPTLPKLHSNDTDVNPLGRPITTIEESWVVSLLSLGASVGPILGGYASDRLGRKRTLLICSIPYIISYILSIFASSVTQLYISRFILGLGVGCTFPLCCIYLAEIAEDSSRGFLSGLSSIFIALGNIAVYSIGPYVSIQVLFMLCLVPLVVFVIIFSFFIPETPYYLYSVNQISEAEKSLKQFRKRSKVGKELEAIKLTLGDTENLEGGFKDLFRSKACVKALIICCGLMVGQQLTGITVVISFTQSIFEATGTNISPEISSIAYGVCTFFVNCVSSLLIDKLGRKILLLFSGIGVSITMGVFGTFLFLLESGYDLSSFNWVPIVTVLCYNVAFSLGFGPIPWIAQAELFPGHVKSLASTISTIVCLFLAFVFTMVFPPLIEIIGMPTAFWLFSVGGLICAIFVAWIVPETKQKSLQEIQEILAGGDKKCSINGELL